MPHTLPTPLPPEPDPDPNTAVIDGTLAQALNNDFIARQQALLHDGPDAFYQKQGADALAATPAVLDQLDALRDRILDTTTNSRQRQIIGQALDDHLTVSKAGIARHAARQTLAWQNATAQNRLDLLRKQSGFDYGDPDSIANYAEASRSAALHQAEIAGLPPGSDEAEERASNATSAVWRTAIEAALAGEDLKPAIALHEQAADRLNSADAAVVARYIDGARERETARTYVASLRLPEGDPSSPLDMEQSLAELAASHAAATAQNNLDWPDDSQRATNQHFIDVTFGRRKNDIIQAKADLDRSVTDWLNELTPDSRPRADRPPLPLWLRLNNDEQRAVDGMLARNASVVPVATEDIEAGQVAGALPLRIDSGQMPTAQPDNSRKSRGRGQVLAQVDDDPKDVPHELKKALHEETPEERAGHHEAPFEILPSPAIGAPGVRLRGSDSPAPQPKADTPTVSRRTIGPGPYATDSIPARSPEPSFWRSERRKLNQIGICYTCGTTDPGTKSGNFVPDHQPPSRLSPPGTPQRLYPQCLSCSRQQGLMIIEQLRKGKIDD